MDYILSGNPKDVERVIQENRIRIRRGVIKFTPVGDAVVNVESRNGDEAEQKDVKDFPETDTKAEPQADTKTVKTKRTKRTE